MANPSKRAGFYLQQRQARVKDLKDDIAALSQLDALFNIRLRSEFQQNQT